MKEFSEPMSLISDKKFTAGDARKPKFFDFPLKDLNIIELQNLFMTPKTHYLKSKDIVTGRNLIYTVLKSLNHYHHVGCVTATKSECLDQNILNLSQIRVTKKSFIETVEIFLVENPNIDFAWVEITAGNTGALSAEQLVKQAQRLLQQGQLKANSNLKALQFD